MPFAVLMTDDAARDLEELYDYIALHDAPQKADSVLSQIEKVFSQLSQFPERGSYLKEYVRKWGQTRPNAQLTLV